MSRGKKTLSLGIVLALVLLLVSAGAVMAAQGNPGGTKQPNAPAGPSLQQIFVEKLAGILGVKTDQLQADLKKAGQETLDEAVKQGIINQNQADRMRSNLEAGRWQGFPGQVGMHGGMRLHLMQPVADALGMTPAQLRQELNNGKTLEQLAAAKGMTLEQLKSKLLASVKSKLDQLVAQGKITQDKADQMLNNLQQKDINGLTGPFACPFNQQ